MDIRITRDWNRKSGDHAVEFFKAGTVYTVTKAVAIEAAVEGYTEDPIALAAADASGAKPLADRSVASMKKPDLIKEIERLRASSDGKALTEAEAKIEDLTTQYAELTEKVDHLEREREAAEAHEAKQAEELAAANEKIAEQAKTLEEAAAQIEALTAPKQN